MSGGLPFGLELCNGTSVIDALTNNGLTLPTSTNVKSAFTTIVDPLPLDVCWGDFLLEAAVGGAVNIAIDIAIGPSGSEVVIIPNLMVSNGGNLNSGAGFNFIVQKISIPISIPAGVRLSARCQTNNLSNAFFVLLSPLLYDGSLTMMEGAAGVDAIGITTTSATEGTIITPDISGGLGSYSQIVSATTRDYIGVFALPDANGQSLTSNHAVTYEIDIAIGASGSEQIIRPQSAITFGDFSEIQSTIDFIPTPIPAGSRIAVRTDGGDEASQPAYGITVYGVYQ